MAYLPKKVKPGDPLLAATINAMQDELRRLGQVRVSGGLSMYMGPGGLTIGMNAIDMSPIKAVVATGGLAARVSATQDGFGDAVLYRRTPGTATRVAGETVKVYNPYDVLIPATTTVFVLPSSGGDYELAGSDCVA